MIEPYSVLVPNYTDNLTWKVALFDAAAAPTTEASPEDEQPVELTPRQQAEVSPFGYLLDTGQPLTCDDDLLVEMVLWLSSYSEAYHAWRRSQTARFREQLIAAFDSLKVKSVPLVDALVFMLRSMSYTVQQAVRSTDAWAAMTTSERLQMVLHALLRPATIAWPDFNDEHRMMVDALFGARPFVPDPFVEPTPPPKGWTVSTSFAAYAAGTLNDPATGCASPGALADAFEAEYTQQPAAAPEE
jgi:hypothetical protein